MGKKGVRRRNVLNRQLKYGKDSCLFEKGEDTEQFYFF